MVNKNIFILYVDLSIQEYSSCNIGRVKSRNKLMFIGWWKRKCDSLCISSAEIYIDAIKEPLVLGLFNNIDGLSKSIML